MGVEDDDVCVCVDGVKSGKQADYIVHSQKERHALIACELLKRPN